MGCDAEANARSKSCVSLGLGEPSLSAKRRARKKRINLRLRAEMQNEQEVAEDICPVRDGARLLLSESCPLCGEDSDTEEALLASAPDVKTDLRCSTETNNLA